MMPRPRLLFIAFHYPPSNTSGTLRTLKFTKHLGECGWDSSVVTVPARRYQSIDPGLSAQIPSRVRVHPAPCFDTKDVFSIWGKYPAFVAIPDRFLSWLPFGVYRALRAIRDEGIHALLSTSPMPTAHLIALCAKMISGVPWIADFRDPWAPDQTPGPLCRAAQRWLESRVVGRADCILATTPELAERISSTHAKRVTTKIHSIYNGYDEDDLEELGPAEPGPSTFTVTHAGVLYRETRHPWTFLTAVRRCLDLGALPRDTRVNFIGAGDLAASRRFAQIVADLRLQDVIRTRERIPYQQALRSMMDSSALLLLQGRELTRTLVPTKAFEYLRTGRPILSLAPADSATWRVLRQFPAVFTANPDDSSEIATSLAALFEMWMNGPRVIDRTGNGLARYSRRSAARQLAGVLDAVTADCQAATDR